MHYKNLIALILQGLRAFKGNVALLKQKIRERLAQLLAPKKARKGVAPRPQQTTEVSESEIHEALHHYLEPRYNFRYNLLNDEVEYRSVRPAVTEGYQRIDRRVLNTLVIDARHEGINCWDKDLQRLLRSHYVESYHPIRTYMDRLPVWDGQDRITPLAQRVSTDELWVNGFRRWLLGLTAQWMGMDLRCAHTLTPLLISPKQGLGKSTFCRLLMPPELRAYYLDKFDLTAQSNAEIKLGQFGLINLDEFDRYSPAALATLKNLVQIQHPTVRRAYTSSFVQLDRIASFIGTSNQLELLNDPTGSRRFLCVEVLQPIDCSPIDHLQLFAQLKHLLEHGERSWMDQEEEAHVQYHNQLFSRLRPELEVFHRLYTLPMENEEPQYLTTTEIHRTLCQANPSAMRGINVLQLGRVLSASGLERVHTKVGNKYAVVRRE